MIEILRIAKDDRQHVKQFVEFPYRFYRTCPQWVPPLFTDAYLPLNPKKHPFYEHSQAEFFLAVQDEEVVGRIAALENKPFNQYHGLRDAEFYFFDSVDNPAVAAALFGAVFDWARERGLDRVLGPKGMSAFDGYGILVDGFAHRQMMTMMNYNYPYYSGLVEGQGFEKEVDFVSCFLEAERFRMPERVARIARRVIERGTLEVKTFATKSELRKWAPRIGAAYNRAFVSNWEYYPLTQREIDFVMDNIALVADHRLIKIITAGDEVVGFLFCFPDVSAGLQRARGRLLPLGLFHLLREMRRARIVAGNGMGILPQYQGHGGNALLYYEMGKTVLGPHYRFEFAEMTQVAETAVQMRADLKNLDGVEYKTHRVYRKVL